MSILFSEIYNKAIGLFDDPKITQAYKTNTVQFQKIMYGYFQNAVSMFVNPLIIASRLANYEPPVGIMEKFASDGETKTFPLDENFEIKENSVYAYTEGDLYIKEGVVLNTEEKTVTFPDVIPEGQEYSIEQYYAGEFLSDFSNINQNTNKINGVTEGLVKDILARLLVKAWAENERNLLLDIRNIMQDSDFKIMDNSKILRAKNEWVDQLDSEVLQYQSRLAWMIRFAGGNISPGLGRG